MRYPVKGKGGQNQSWFTLVEVKVALTQEADRLTHEVGLRARTTRGMRTLDIAHVINAVLADYLTESPAERTRRARRGQSIFEGLAALDKPAYFSTEGQAPAGNNPGNNPGRRRKSAGPTQPVTSKGLGGYGRSGQDPSQRRNGAPAVAADD